MTTGLTKRLFYLFVLLAPVASVVAQSHDRVEGLINHAISSAGGLDRWYDSDTQIVHESQRRNEEDGMIRVNLVHWMKTDGSGYRVELTREGRKFTYGWDGSQFWATAEGEPGDHELVREARRVIADGYFRFSLPFVLQSDIHDLEFTGTDSVDGSSTSVVKITYHNGPVDRYFSGKVAEEGHHAEADQEQHGTTHKTEPSHQADAGHSSAGGGHHHGGEIYFFHFDDSGKLVKIYFSHHGDGTYETFLLSDIKKINGISREHKRTLLRPDGELHYESVFGHIEFRNDLPPGLFTKP